MNYTVLEYIRQIENKELQPGIECNSMLLNILIRLHPDHNTDSEEVIKQLKECETLFGVRKIIRDNNRTARKYLKKFGYEEIQSYEILPGDFLIKSGKYFDDCVYKLDSITYCGIAPINRMNKRSACFMITRNMHISKEHKIYRKVN